MLLSVFPMSLRPHSIREQTRSSDQTLVASISGRSTRTGQSDSTRDETNIPQARNPERVRETCRIYLEDLKDLFKYDPDFFTLKGDFDPSKSLPSEEAQMRKAQRERVARLSEVVDEFKTDTRNIHTMHNNAEILEPENPALAAPELHMIEKKLDELVRGYNFVFHTGSQTSQAIPTTEARVNRANKLTTDASELLNLYFSQEELKPMKRKKGVKDHVQGVVEKIKSGARCDTM